MTTHQDFQPGEGSISAERAVENLMAQYSYFADAGDFAGLGELFADGEYTFQGQVFRGRDEVTKFTGGTLFLHDGRPGTKHVLSNTTIEVDAAGETARARAYYTVFQSLPDFPLQAVGGGEYRDTFQRVAGQWRFTRREVTADMFGDMSRLMEPPR